MSVEALTEIRDTAHLNQAAFASAEATAQQQYDWVRDNWTNSPTRQALLLQLTNVITHYKLGAKHAIALRDTAAAALAELLAEGEEPPPFPETSGATWGAQEW